MKGLHHSVIEIKDTQNSEIEKILVFLRPGQQKIDIDATRQDAQEILQKVKIRDRMSPLKRKQKLFFLTVAIIAAAVTLLVVIF